MTKYIASCSFGKDSLAMLIKIKELGIDNFIETKRGQGYKL